MASGPPSPETVCGCCDVYVCVSSGDNFRSFVNIKMGLIKGQKKKLISKRDSLKKKIEEIKKTERVISDAVLEWLDEVEKVIQEEENLKKETLTHGHICFCFPGTTVRI
ncbi:hypothetical protein VNO77_36858 [Canavalia gladiata]|uniref:Uncharacterized protein n=1 Tax=Canavalia gladiata TaxID=3824 RepID=A0AAN9PVV1_CANGL